MLALCIVSPSREPQAFRDTPRPSAFRQNLLAGLQRDALRFPHQLAVGQGEGECRWRRGQIGLDQGDEAGCRAQGRQRRRGACGPRRQTRSSQPLDRWPARVCRDVERFGIIDNPRLLQSTSTPGSSPWRPSPSSCRSFTLVHDATADVVEFTVMTFAATVTGNPSLLSFPRSLFLKKKPEMSLQPVTS